MAEKDRINDLPAHILDNILEFLPIQEAAKTAVLSTFWEDIWFSLTKLNFDYRFFDYICLKYSYLHDWTCVGVYVINEILMQHNGPIRKFVLHFPEELFEPTDKLPSSDIDRWLLLLIQNGVEEIDLYVSMDGYKVPNCIFSCPTLKRLNLSGVSVELINANCVLPNVTSICFKYVDFKPRNHLDCVVHLPMLEDLSFVKCEDMFYINIVAPKLGSLTINSFKCSSCYPKEFGFLPPNLDLRSISTLDLVYSFGCFEEFIEELTRVGQQPLALNVEHLKLSIHSRCEDYINISAFIHLLRICPKLCKLDIGNLVLNPEDFELLKELSSVALTQKMLRTLKFSSFWGSRSEMQSIKVLLACFLGIEKIVIIRAQEFDSDKEFKIMQELLRFPRASIKAEIVYV